MMILPKGLVSRTRIFPLATWLFIALIGVFSFLHFGLFKNAKALYFSSENRVEYSQAAKSFIINNCQQSQAKAYCEGLENIPDQAYLFSQNLGRFDKANFKQRAHLHYIRDELAPERLFQSKPSLLEKQILAKRDLQFFVKRHNLLSRDSLHWVAGFRSIFLTSGWLHFISCVLLLLMFAKPVEERMGPFFYSLTFVTCGFFGNYVQAFVFPGSFFSYGPNAAIAGALGAFIYFFSSNYLVIEVNLFGKARKQVLFPALAFSGVLAGGLFAIDEFNPFLQNSMVANVVGFLGGLGLAAGYNALLPLHPYMVFPYELKFLERSKQSLSQYDRVRVFIEWLYYAPVNLYAFHSLVKELERSDQHFKVNKEVQKFRQACFFKIYRLNRHDIRFFKLVPTLWLRYVPLGTSEKFLIKYAIEFRDKRDFVNAFKMCFLILNQKGWHDAEWRMEIYKNYKKASVNPKFKADATKLYDTHAAFKRLLNKRGEQTEEHMIA